MSKIASNFAAVIARRRAGGVVDLANLTARWRADGDVYNTGTTQATDTQTAETWIDDTGNGWDFIQSVAGDRPVFRTAQQNGLPGIEFVSSDGMYVGSSPLGSNPGPFTIYVVSKCTDDATNQALCGFVDNTAANTIMTVNAKMDTTGNPSRIIVNNGTVFGGVDSSAGSAANTTVLTTGMERSATDREVWHNNANSGTNTTNVVQSAINDFSVGYRRSSPPANYFTGLIFEIRLYAVAHSVAVRNAVTSQLQTYWGF